MKNVLLAALSLLAAVPALAQTSEVRTVPAFHALDVSTGIELTLVAGDAERVEASADTPENLARIKTTVSDGVLHVKFEWLKSQPWRGTNHGHQLRVAVTAAQLTGIRASSGASVEVRGTYPTGSLELATSSGATLHGEFAATAMQVRLSSGSTIEAAGTTKRIDVRTSSGASFNGKRLQADECQATASSGASVQVGVQSILTAQASSGGNISYHGSPQVTKHTSSGGSVSVN